MSDDGVNEGGAVGSNARRRHSSSHSPETEGLPSKPPINLKSSSSNMPIPNGTTLAPVSPVKDYAELKGPSLLKKTLGLQNHRHSCYVGLSTELEPSVLRLANFDRREEALFAHHTIRRVSEKDLFVMQVDHATPQHANEIGDLDAIESIVAPYGKELVNLYFRIVHPSFPILHKRVFLEKYARTYREFSPPLLAAVYVLALNWWSYSPHLTHLSKPNVENLEAIALKSISNVSQRPKLSTVQAGLLLLQRPHQNSALNSSSLTAQVIVLGQALGLHLDCSTWRIPNWEIGLRRRLAWGLYMQDKWGALIYGRPSQIHADNWDVRDVTEDDFPENATDEDEAEGSTEVHKGMLLFMEMIKLTKILSGILERFYSLTGLAKMDRKGNAATHWILESAKPLQLALRNWFAGLDESLRMESTKVMKLSSTGYLHLAYYAAEITLHRVILRSLTLDSSSAVPLTHVVRSAARARLVSGIEFVYRLRPEHLQSFWYFASKINLAIIGSFGCLLWATAETKEEGELYREKLSEYKWTLKVSSRGVEFMEHAMEVIDAGVALLSSSEHGKVPAAEQPSGNDEVVEKHNVTRRRTDGDKVTKATFLAGAQQPLHRFQEEYRPQPERSSSSPTPILTRPQPESRSHSYSESIEQFYPSWIHNYSTSPTDDTSTVVGTAQDGMDLDFLAHLSPPSLTLDELSTSHSTVGILQYIQKSV